MPESVAYCQSRNVISVKSTGILTAQEIRCSFEKILNIKENIGVDKLLVDQTKVQSIPTNVEAFNLGTSMAYSLKDISIAIIYSDRIKYDLEFIERVTQVRGGNLRLFKDESTALDWLNNSNTNHKRLPNPGHNKWWGKMINPPVT